MNYKARLSKDKSVSEQENIDYAVTEAALVLDGTVNKTNQELATAKRALEASKDATSFNPQAIIDAQIRVEGLEDGLARLTALKTEMFSAE